MARAKAFRASPCFSGLSIVITIFLCTQDCAKYISTVEKIIMDVDGLPIIGPGVDFTQVTPIQQKRMYAFMNHFITNTVSFLNKFSRSCELRLQDFDSRLQKLEAALCILEAKLNSINGLDDSIPIAVPSIDKTIENEPQNNEQNNKEQEAEREIDPVISKFTRLIQVGVPVKAVKLKMQTEGLDPSIIDNYTTLSNLQARKEEDSESDSSD